MFETHPVSLVGIDPRFKLSTVEIIVKVKQRTKSRVWADDLVQK